MKTLTPNTLIKAKGFDISIGIKTTEIALISHTTGSFATFSSIKKGGRLSKIKRKFRSNICSSEHFFFCDMNQQETELLIKLLK
jgi:hypothetical protein